MLNSVRKMSWQKTQLWGLYKTQYGSDPDEVRAVCPFDWLRILPFQKERDTSGLLSPGNSDMKAKLIAIGGAIREDFNRPLHVMKLDSDDMVSEDLVSFVTERPGTNFMVRRGYVWYAPSYELTLSRGFHQLSGSRCIFWVSPSDLPTSPEDRRALYSQIMQSPHEETFLSLGRTVDRVHWPAVMYRRGNAEAISNDYATASYKRPKNSQRSSTQRILRKASQLIWKSYVAATRQHMRKASQTEPVFRRFGITNPGCETCELGR